MSSPFLDLNLSFILTLKARFVSKGKVVSANADTVLIAFNKRMNMNINKGNWANRWEALRVLLWPYDFYDMGHFTE